MTDFNWDEVNVDETITEDEQKAAENIDFQVPAGIFTFEVMECVPVEKTFKAYSCIAAKLKMKITGIMEIEQVLIDDNGLPVKRNGEVVKKVQPINPAGKKKYEALCIGQFIYDEVNGFNPSEKPAMKKRRVYVAKSIGIIDNSATTLSGKDWQNSVGCCGTVETENNYWEKDGERKMNVRVGWAGYKKAPAAGLETGTDGKSHQNTTAASPETDVFDI